MSMKHFRILLLLAACIISLQAFCQNAVEINGIYYNLIIKSNGNIAEVTSKPSKYSGSVHIPESVYYDGNDYTVTKICDNAFKDCSGLTSVTIPISITSIGKYAFYGSSGLTSVTIPNSVTSIGNSAFCNCSSLTSITIPNSITYIDAGVFRGCSCLTSITIPNSVTYIDMYAFCDCTGLTSVNIPNSVTSIGNSAFSECSGLTSVTIPNSVTSIGSGAFAQCSGLTSVTIPNSVTSIDFSVFNCCSSLTSVIIPNSVTSIGRLAFNGCSGLTSVTLGNSVITIDEMAFGNCSGLTSVTIPNNVTSIGSCAFLNCTGLTSLNIGSGVKRIYGQAFSNCSKLETVTCLAENVPNTDNNVFEDSYIQLATLYVPSTSLNSYKTTVPWSEFGTFKTIGGQDVQKCATPTISYGGKKLTFSCATEGVSYVYEIKDTDIKTGYNNEVTLSATYEISVYATKPGYENSDMATATLVWTNGTFTETTPPASAISQATEFAAKALLIQNNGGTLTIQGTDDGTPVSIYNSGGIQVGSTISKGGVATANTSLQPGSIAIVKIGNKAIKVVMK